MRRLILSLLGAGLMLAGSNPSPADPRWRLGVFPVANFQAYTSHYGPRSLDGGVPRLHNGLDIAAPLGSPVRSWWRGQVVEIIDDSACGIGVVVRSGAYDHIYCHLHGSVSGGTYRSGPLQLRSGQMVRFGERIGHVGLTGHTTGPHLHWGMRYQGEWLDPGRILRAMAASQVSP
jgi:murein DD-endopeptidase MepM/ murein hydrolase activator NlpD